MTIANIFLEQFKKTYQQNCKYILLLWYIHMTLLMRNWQKGNIYHIYYILYVYYNLLDNCCFCEYFKQEDGGPDQRFWYLTNDSSNLWIRYARTNPKCMEYNVSDRLYGLKMQITDISRN